MENTGSKERKLSAEAWVDIARKFGEKCVEIQHDSNLSLEQRLDKQKKLSEELSNQIQNDSNLNAEEKKAMITSVKSYMDDWTKMFQVMQQSGTEQKNKS